MRTGNGGRHRHYRRRTHHSTARLSAFQRRSQPTRSTSYLLERSAMYLAQCCTSFCWILTLMPMLAFYGTACLGPYLGFFRPYVHHFTAVCDGRLEIFSDMRGTVILSLNGNCTTLDPLFRDSLTQFLGSHHFCFL